MGGRSQKSGDRSQNGSCARIQYAAGFFEHGHEHDVRTVSEILSKDQVIAALFEGALGDVQEANFLWFAAAPKSFRYVCGD
jgi:hypothetical protein